MGVLSCSDRRRGRLPRNSVLRETPLPNALLLRRAAPASLAAGPAAMALGAVFNQRTGWDRQTTQELQEVAQGHWVRYLRAPELTLRGVSEPIAPAAAKSV